MIVMTAFAMPFVSHAATSANVTIDGRPLVFTDQAPVILNNRVLVPVRDVFEVVGFDVQWNPAARVVTITNHHHTIIVGIGDSFFTVNGIRHPLETPAQIINDRTMLPIRALLESVEFDVSWNNETRTVEISSPLVGHWSEISISGDAQFVRRTNEALDLIRNGPPEFYVMVLRYMGAITQGSHSGMRVRWTPPTFMVGTPTYNSSTTWYASTIVHDAVHSRQYHQHRAATGRTVPNHVFSGMEAEMEALDVQIAFLIAIGAPTREIEHAESLIGTEWWNETPTW